MRKNHKAAIISALQTIKNAALYVLVGIGLFFILFNLHPRTAFISFSGNFYDEGIKISPNRLYIIKGIENIEITHYYKQANDIDTITCDDIYINDEKFELNADMPERGANLKVSFSDEINATNNNSPINDTDNSMKITIEMNDNGKEYINAHGSSPGCCFLLPYGFNETPFTFSNYDNYERTKTRYNCGYRGSSYYWSKNDFYDAIITFPSSTHTLMIATDFISSNEPLQQNQGHAMFLAGAITVYPNDTIRLTNAELNVGKPTVQASYNITPLKDDFYFELFGITKCKINDASGKLVFAQTAKSTEYNPLHQSIEFATDNLDDNGMGGTLSSGEGYSTNLAIGGMAKTAKLSQYSLFPNFRSWLYENTFALVMMVMSSMFAGVIGTIFKKNKDGKTGKAEK
ncbi:MAG: hypothetical protein LBB91_00920 [Clostridiales bacterium]|jgi:hypothetical protein|nr:hypothetical protein [Clostridiales bacterium]